MAWYLITHGDNSISAVSKRLSYGEDDTLMDLKETDWDVMNWIHLDQDGDRYRACVNTVMNPWVS
jgi:hypothetical protein